MSYKLVPVMALVVVYLAAVGPGRAGAATTVEGQPRQHTKPPPMDCKTDQDCTKSCAARHGGSGHCDTAKRHCACDKGAGAGAGAGAGKAHRGKTSVHPHAITPMAAEVPTSPTMNPEPRSAPDAAASGGPDVAANAAAPTPAGVSGTDAAVNADAAGAITGGVENAATPAAAAGDTTSDAGGSPAA